MCDVHVNNKLSALLNPLVCPAKLPEPPALTILPLALHTATTLLAALSLT